MREFWVNVFRTYTGRQIIGAAQPSRESAKVRAAVAACNGARPLYRLRVKLKDGVA